MMVERRHVDITSFALPASTKTMRYGTVLFLLIWSMTGCEQTSVNPQSETLEKSVTPVDVQSSDEAPAVSDTASNIAEPPPLRSAKRLDTQDCPAFKATDITTAFATDRDAASEKFSDDTMIVEGTVKEVG